MGQGQEHHGDNPVKLGQRCGGGRCRIWWRGAAEDGGGWRGRGVDTVNERKNEAPTVGRSALWPPESLNDVRDGGEGRALERQEGDRAMGDDGG